MENSMLIFLARKMNISSQKVILNASEFLRVVNVRCGSGSLAKLNLSGSCAAVICLEIAALSSGLSTTKTTAIKLSGMPQKMYMNAYKAIECVLGKQKQMSVKDLAVMFGCVSSVTLAEQVLKRYTDSHNGTVDVNQSIFAAASLYAVCRSQKVKMDKMKLINQINVRRSMFDKVSKRMQDILAKLPDNSKEKHLKRPYSWLEVSHDEPENEDREVKKTRITEKELNEKRDMDYEAWKLKLLNAAKISES